MINIFESSYRIINKYNQKTQKPKCYGSDIKLYAAEVHMLDVIGSHNEVTVTQLAHILGVTKGAVSQTVSKLAEKNLIEKNQSPRRKNEVIISLSISGREVFDYHRSKHRDLHSRIEAIMTGLPQESTEAVGEIIALIEQLIDES